MMIFLLGQFLVGRVVQNGLFLTKSTFTHYKLDIITGYSPYFVQKTKLKLMICSLAKLPIPILDLIKAYFWPISVNSGRVLSQKVF